MLPMRYDPAPRLTAFFKVDFFLTSEAYCMASGLIQPRQVSPDAWRNWISQGFELITRKWPAWIAIMTVSCLLTGAAGVAEPIAEFLTLAVGFNLAVAVDHESGWAGMAARFGALFRDAAVFAFQVGIFVLVACIPLHAAMAAQALAMPDIQVLAGGATEILAVSDFSTLLAALYEKSANNLATWAMLLPVGLGFLYPLRSFGIGFLMALTHGRKATALNRNPVILIAALSFITVLGLLSLHLYPLIPLVEGFWMAVNYAMFRDIFLGISRNRPLRAEAASRAGIPEAAAS
jgi:hypothetical protein